MKVILQKDVPKIGHKYDVKDVADGYALNCLIPQGKAKIATPDALKKIDALKFEIEAERKIQEDLLSKNLHQIDGKEVVIKAKANDKGHLFAALHSGDIANAIKQGLGADVSSEFIICENHLKEVGEHIIEVKAHNKSARVKLIVEAE